MQEVAAEALADEAKDELRRAAFIGWQFYLTQPDYSKRPKKKTGFGEYLKKMGLAERSAKADQAELDKALQQADEVDALVRAAFKKPVQA